MMKQSILLYLLLMIFWLPITANAEYTLYTNKGLKFCQDFLAYLNRKPVGYYYYELLPDPEFPDLTFPRLKELDKKEWLERYKVSYLGRYQRFIKTEKQKDEFQNKWEKIASGRYWDDDFRILGGKMDVNHDGELDHVIVREKNYSFEGFLMKQQIFHVVDEDGYYDKEKDASDHGIFFFHKGRFYIASINPKTSVYIYEPSRDPYPYHGFYWNGGGVCDLREVRQK